MSDTITQILREKLHNISISDVHGLFDHDLTMADKLDPVDPDNAPLTPQNYAGFAALAPMLGSAVILTARGQNGVIGYYHGIENVAIASNSGHRYLPHGINAQAEDISIPGYSQAMMGRVIEGMYVIANSLAVKYGQYVKTDLRELCAASIFSFPGNLESDIHKAYHADAAALRAKLPEDVAQRIEFAPKSFMPAGENRTNGYIDFKPKGMDKGHTAYVILTEKQSLTDQSFVIVAGDSAPDYRMMEEVSTFVLPSRRLFISVGEELARHDQKHNNIVDIVLPRNGHSPVDRLHLEILQRLTEFTLERSPRSPFSIWTAHPGLNAGAKTLTGPQFVTSASVDEAAEAPKRRDPVVSHAQPTLAPGSSQKQ